MATAIDSYGRIRDFRGRCLVRVAVKADEYHGDSVCMFLSDVDVAAMNGVAALLDNKLGFKCTELTEIEFRNGDKLVSADGQDEYMLRHPVLNGKWECDWREKGTDGILRFVDTEYKLDVAKLIEQGFDYIPRPYGDG